MWRRIRIYFIGLILGAILSWALVIRDRNTKELMSWTPNERILADIRNDSNITLPDNFWCLLKCQGFSSIEYNELLINGDVDLSESSPRTYPKIYRIQFDAAQKGTLLIDFELDSINSTITKVSRKEDIKNCNC